MQPGAFAKEAQWFASSLSSLLNRTVCDGPPIGAATNAARDLAYVGYGVGHGRLTPKALPLAHCRSRERLFAVLSYTLSQDEQGEHLMVVSSVLGLCLDEEEKRVLFHADYERNKSDGYPESHLQIHADSEDWRALLSGTDDDRPLGDLHLPAGGRRFRPTVEDLVEFVISERLVAPREGWQDAVAEHRRDFEIRQLRAAVRRDPEVAREALERYGS